MRRWQFLAELIARRGYTSFCEVGCKEGRTTGYVLKRCPDCHVIAIDPWAPRPQGKGIPGGETYEDWDFGAIEDIFHENVQGHEARLTFHRAYSRRVALDVPDASLDLVFIDGAHDYDSVVHDIEDWRHKVKPGGVLAGHDYNHRWPSVNRAVADSIHLMQVKLGPDSLWFVEPLPGDAA